MSADRETNHGMSSHGMSGHGMSGHDMTNSDIALLLADAADEVEIGIAPYDAVLRGGRRRKARRWAVATATALVLVGSAGTLAVAGMPGGEGDRGAAVATQPVTTVAPELLRPRTTVLASGIDKGRAWRVDVDVWTAPRDEAEARAQLEAIASYEGAPPTGISKPAELVGKSAYFAHSSIGKDGSAFMENTVLTSEILSGTDIQAAAFPLERGSGGPQRLVVGQVAKTAREVTCTWRDGTATVVPAVPKGELAPALNDDPVIRPVQGSPANWFVCLAPDGTSYEAVEVTK
ncbi:hypothetical protein IM697_10125 [Streptomyces ferrugineus]|uniref:Uncharacterized protein n=1 Tax=Streptomyces ferrugineus TaxID=1413221 RepID=A0A7M2SR29_9ACTN|nr:hypothetical protein [Streptomyces ferrugineus]QOV38694.1 hypothetical protein IM697_10125 [Streptomyces ferrugineus]